MMFMAPKKAVPEFVRKSNKFRLVVFEGDMSDGSVAEIAQALSAALRPTAPTVVRQLPNGRPAGQLLAPEAEEEIQTDEVDILEGEEEHAETEAAEPKLARPARTKTYKNPDFVELEWNGTGAPPLSLKDFAKTKAPKTKARKYLIATFWLKEHASCPSVNINMMYSCFKTVGWSVGFKDWRQTFDNLVHSEHLRKVGTGEFSITTLGEGTLQIPEA